MNVLIVDGNNVVASVKEITDADLAIQLLANDTWFIIRNRSGDNFTQHELRILAYLATHDYGTTDKLGGAARLAHPTWPLKHLQHAGHITSHYDANTQTRVWSLAA